MSLFEQGVASKHKMFRKFEGQWNRLRIAFGGTDDVKDSGELFLPRLSKQTDDEYRAYKMRALWNGFPERTTRGLNVPARIEQHLQDITLTGVDFETFAKNVLLETLLMGRFGVLTDMPVNPEDVRGELLVNENLAEDPTQVRPYHVGYMAEQIINWRTVRRQGDTILSMVVLQEMFETMGKNEFEFDEEVQFRVLFLDETGFYAQSVWRKIESAGAGDKFQEVQRFEPRIRGQRIDYIPFCFYGPETVTPDVQKSPVIDLTDVAYSWYRSSADLEHGRHFTALPTPWVTGVSRKDVTLKIGSSTAWVLENKDAKVGMLEFSGQGLGALERALEEKVRLAATLGARLLEQRPKGVEAAETLRLRQVGEESLLQSVAGTVGAGLTKNLQWHADFMGIEQGNISTQINKDFQSLRLKADDLRILMELVLGELISWETFYDQLERGEITRPGIDAEDERTEITNQEPLGGTIPNEETDVTEE